MGGPLAGTRLEIDDAVDEILVGSDPDCRLSLDLPGVSPIHARVWRDLGGITVYDTRSPRGLYVNDERVVDQAALRDGDVLWLGAPGDADSVMIQCRLPEESFLGAPVTEAGFGAIPDAMAEPVPALADEPPAVAAPADPDDDAAFLLDAPPAEVVAPKAGPASPAVPVVDESPFVILPEMVEAAPAAAAPAPKPIVDEDFAMDPAWGAYDTVEASSDAAPLELDSLLGDAPISEPAVIAGPPPSAPRREEPIALGAPAVASADSGPATPVIARQIGGAPPVTPAPRAIIDDTRPAPAPRKAGGARPGPPEGVMDWARGAPPADSADGPGPPVRPAARGARVRERSGRGPLLPLAGGAVVLAAIAGGYFAWTASRTPRIDAVSPARVTAGETLTITGANLGETAAATSASVGGRPARVLQATGDRVQIEVPDVPTAAGRETSVAVAVTSAGRASNPAAVALYLAPRLTSLAPDVAMPGDNVVLTGTSLSAAVTVRFGDAEAEVVDVTPASLTVRVPALPGAPGTELPVVAAMGSDRSNAITFVIGKVPLVTGVEPRSASPGDLVTAAGRGFSTSPLANRVTVGGVPALVITAGPRAIEFIVPRVIAGEETVSITVPGSPQVGQAAVAIIALPEPIGFRFVAEPFEDVPGHEHAAVASGLGPAFVLTSAQGKSAAERAYETAKRLNDAAQVLRSTRTADIRARYEPAPALFLAGRDTVLVEVASADAEAYNEDWTHSRTKGTRVTPARLATWWEAVARDLVLLLLRGEKPQYALAIAPGGKVLADLHDAARRTVSVGVPSAIVPDKGSMREALRALVLRVPPGVDAPVARAEGAAPAAAETAPLKLDGSWHGAESESGVQTAITVVFRGGSGTLTYERALRMSVPALGVQQAQKGAVRFEVRVGAGSRFYRGRWDGSRITGKVTSDAEGRTDVGSFDLEPGS